MQTMNKYSFGAAMIMILFISVFACQAEDQAMKAQASDSSLQASADTAGFVAEKLASMNMYHFKQPVDAPDFELRSLSGEKVTLSQYRGKVVMLSFWATW